MQSTIKCFRRAGIRRGDGAGECRGMTFIPYGSGLWGGGDFCPFAPAFRSAGNAEAVCELLTRSRLNKLSLVWSIK